MRKSRIAAAGRHAISGWDARTSSGIRFAASPMTSRLRTTASCVLRSEENCSNDIPFVYSSIFAIACSMSSKYTLGSRGALVILFPRPLGGLFHESAVLSLSTQGDQLSFRAHLHALTQGSR